jgi:hypothetical protein
MEPIQLIIYALATWRIASLLVNEDGPWEIFRKIRINIAGIGYDGFGRVSMVPDNLLAGILSCVWCCSVWIGTFMAIFWIISPSISFVFAFPLALSSLAIGYERLIRGKE